MDAGKIVRLVAVIVAVVVGLGVPIPQSAVIIAVLGLVAGYFIEDSRVVYLLVATLVLNVASGGADAIPYVGQYLTDIFSSVRLLFNAGALTAITMQTGKALKT